MIKLIDDKLIDDQDPIHRAKLQGMNQDEDDHEFYVYESLADQPERLEKDQKRNRIQKEHLRRIIVNRDKSESWILKVAHLDGKKVKEVVLFKPLPYYWGGYALRSKLVPQ